MNRREVFGRIAGMTAAAVALAQLKGEMKREVTPADLGLEPVVVHGKTMFASISTSTQVNVHHCWRCGGQTYGIYDGRGICKCGPVSA